MTDALVTFPAPDPELDSAATVEYVQWLVDYDMDAMEPRVLPAFDLNTKRPEEELRSITVISVVVRDGAVQVYFTLEYAVCFEVPATTRTANPVHVVHGQVIDSNWEFPVLNKAGLLTTG